MRLLAIVLTLMMLCGCRTESVQLAPDVARLVGTWQLRDPMSFSSYPAVRLQLDLDTKNPPRDITPFIISGTVLGSAYNGRLSAALDGTMVVTELSDAPVSSSAGPSFTQTYLTNLKSVVRYGYTSTNRLHVSFGSPGPGTLEFEKIN